MRQLKLGKNGNKEVRTYETEKVFKAYSKEIDHDILTADEEAKLAKKIKEGDEIALNKLVKSNLKFVVSVAKLYQGQGLPLPELINEGNIGLIKAARKFDATRGFKFISYAVWWIRQSILSALYDERKKICPKNHQSNLTKINKARNRLLQENSYKEPSTEEIAKEADMTISLVKDVLSRSKATLSLNEYIGLEEGNTLLDKISSPKIKDYEYSREKSLARVDQVLSSFLSHEEAIIFKFINGIKLNNQEQFLYNTDIIESENPTQALRIISEKFPTLGSVNTVRTKYNKSLKKLQAKGDIIQKNI